MPIEKRGLTFFHGTSTAAAIDILSSGARDALGEIGCRELASEILTALLKHGNEWELNQRFSRARCESPGLMALRSMHDRDRQGQYAYGHFFATLNIGNAYRYAVGNPLRSEYLLTISDSLKILRGFEDPLVDEVPSRYPEVVRAIESSSPAVVLELTNIDEGRLTLATGGSEIEPEIEDFLAFPEQGWPAAFRIENVKPSDVIAVHDLSDWSRDDIVPSSRWRPNPDRVAIVRKSAEQWRALVR